MEAAQLEGAATERIARAHHERRRERLAHHDGAHRPRLLEGTAGNLHVARVARLHLEANRPRLEQRGAVSGGVPQTHRILVRILHPYHHRSVALIEKAKRRNGHVPRHRTRTELCLHHAPNRIGYICHQCGIPAHPGSMDAKHYFCHSGMVLLLQGAKLIRKHEIYRFRLI